MTVYVDDMYTTSMGEFKRGMHTYKMSHMIADTTEELKDMASKIGVDKKWLQYPGTYKEHFDITMAARERALRLGARSISMRQCGMMIRNRRLNGTLGEPDPCPL